MQDQVMNEREKRNGKKKGAASKARGWMMACAVLAGLLSAGGVSAQSYSPAFPGLIGWWTGDSNANDIYSTNNGTLLGGATAGNPGYVGGAMVFDGTNGYCSIPDSQALHPTNLTIETWMRCDLLDTPTTTSYPGQQYIIFHQNANYGNFEGFDLAKDRHPPYFGTVDTWCFEVTSVGGQNIFIESMTNVQTNVWYHVAGVRGSNYIALYVNGILQGQSNVDFPVGYGNWPLYFATTGQSYYDHKFAGALDEVKFYDRALSSNEIYAIFAAGHAGQCETPMAVALNLTPTNTTQLIPSVTIGGLPGQNYEVQAAYSPLAPTNSWTPLADLTLSDTSNIWYDTEPVDSAVRYYRVVTNAPAGPSVVK
jgi:hypothetical protein